MELPGLLTDEAAAAFARSQFTPADSDNGGNVLFEVHDADQLDASLAYTAAAEKDEIPEDTPTTIDTEAGEEVVPHIEEPWTEDQDV